MQRVLLQKARPRLEKRRPSSRGTGLALGPWSGLVHLFDALDVLIKSETSKTKTHNATQNKAKQNTSHKISRYIPTTMNKILLVLIAMMIAAASSAAIGKADIEYVTGSFSLYNCLV